MKSIYLVAYYFQKPAHDRVKTGRPGWMKDAANTSWDEQVAITRNLKNRDITMSKIILDLANKKIVRNAWRSGADFDELFKYFNGNYPEQTRGIMLQLDPAYYFTMFPEQAPQPAPGSAPDFVMPPPPAVRVVDTATHAQ